MRITPWLEDIDALAQGGADIIATDGTQRQRPASVSALLAEIHQLGKVAMADCSSLDDALECWQLGAEMRRDDSSPAIPQRRRRMSRIWRWCNA